MAKLILYLFMQYYAILFVESIVSAYCSPNNAKGYVLLCKFSSYLSSVHASTTSSVISSLTLLCATLVFRFVTSGLSLSAYLDAHVTRAEDDSPTTTMGTISSDDDTHSLLGLPGSFSRALKSSATSSRFLSVPSTDVHVSPLPTNTIEGYASEDFAGPAGTNIRYTRVRFTMPLVPFIRIHHVEIGDCPSRGTIGYGNGSDHQHDDRTKSTHGPKSNDTTECAGRKQSSTGSSPFTTATGSGSGFGRGDDDDDDDKNRKRGHHGHHDTAGASSSSTSTSSQTSDSDPESDTDTNSGSISGTDTRRGGIRQRRRRRLRLRPHPAFGTGSTTPLTFDLTTDPGYMIQDQVDDADVDTDTDGSEFRNSDGDSDGGGDHGGERGQDHLRRQDLTHRWQDHRGRRLAWDWTAMPQN
ncbi:uncharacterized protein PV06_02401 [Exophiala oligosperma]|uniref:Uncharacterized protein n=1 Tax=Exophiala oligosperma TaxID=215243 RepID=A0A0D2CA70_9EURO|nr:uncharacterized protein PV06_02401 [Exophiala oligosperma]KIW46757.1 hypothetical protein PV06_02401 [Exophiala oligosperma]